MIALLLTLLTQPALASDHIDGPVTTAHRVGDLTDLYAFPTPNKPGSLSIILDTYPLVGATGHFSDKVSYTIYLRRAAVKGTGDHPVFATSDEVSIACSFKTPELAEGIVATCKTSSGAIAEAKFNVIGPKQEGDDFRLFAGMRADPFFFNLAFATLLSKMGIILPGYLRFDQDIMKHFNILTMVMEIEPAKLWKENTPSLIALAAESVAHDTPDAAPRRLDWVGRPEITNVTMAAHKGDGEIRDDYNLERPFQMSRVMASTVHERIYRNIGLYDKADKKQDWDDAGREALTTILADDFLVVDTSKSCDGANFFDIEKALLKHQPYTNCGGRRPRDDIMSILYTMYVGGLNGKVITDGVGHPYREPSEEFPYLAEPDLSMKAAARRAFFLKLQHIKD